MKDAKHCQASAIMTSIDDVEYLQDTKGSHSHSNYLLKKQVRKIEDEYVRNAAANPTIAPFKYST